MAKRSQSVPKSCEEIARLSGLDIYQVRLIATRRSWDEVSFGDMRKFCQACGVDFENPTAMHRVTEYVRNKPSWSALKRSPDWATVYEPLFKIFLSIDP